MARFKAAYATPIPALTDQSQWPEVEIEFSMCPPLTKRKAGRPKESRFKAWFEKGGSSKKGKGKKDENPKRSQKGNKNRCKLCQELGHRKGSPKCRYTPERPKYVYVCVFLIWLLYLITSQITSFVFQEEAWRSTPCC